MRESLGSTSDGDSCSGDGADKGGAGECGGGGGDGGFSAARARRLDDVENATRRGGRPVMERQYPSAMENARRDFAQRLLRTSYQLWDAWIWTYSPP
jgi:hypothetical protein